MSFFIFPQTNTKIKILITIFINHNITFHTNIILYIQYTGMNTLDNTLYTVIVLSDISV